MIVKLSGLDWVAGAHRLLVVHAHACEGIADVLHSVRRDAVARVVGFGV